MSADYAADATVASSPPPRRRRRYRGDVRTIDDLDGRTAPARRARDLSARLRAEIGAGNAPTTAQNELIARCTMLSILAGDCEIKIMGNQPIDIHGYVALVNCQRRALQALGGLQRDPKIIDGTTQTALDAQFSHIWPEHRQAEAARAARGADSMAKLIAALGSDDEPPKNDEPPTPEEPQL